MRARGLEVQTGTGTTPVLVSRPEAGIAVLCEKPLEASVDAAQALAGLVKQHDTLFMPAFCHRFHPAIIELKKLIDGGVLGELLLFRNIFGGYFQLGNTFRADRALSGGGALIDNGCHSIDLYRFLMGDPTDVQAHISTVLQTAPVEDLGMFNLAIGGKRHGHIVSSYSLKASVSAVSKRRAFTSTPAPSCPPWHPSVP